MITVTRVEPHEGFFLTLSFSDGSSGVADLWPLLRASRFAELRDAESFMTVTIEDGAVSWPTTGIGIATEALFALVHELPYPETDDEARANEESVASRPLAKSTPQ